MGLLYDETERRREMAKHSLERYTHYYECWARNQLMEKLRGIQRGPESQLKFITDTWQQQAIDSLYSSTASIPPAIHFGGGNA
ncbi:hypothetical protein ACE6H2_001926 [Prunus campanulata]